MNNTKMTTKEKEKAFNNWRHNAVHLTFPNGNSLSTVWGYCTYSDNYDFEGDGVFNTFMGSDTVEIMILSCPDKLEKRIKRKYNFEDDNAKGYLTMKEWLEIVNFLSK